MTRAAEALERLLATMQRLRDPEHGCPWDREQRFATIAPFTIEEAYEVADAIAREDWARLPEELGDLLFQVIFYAQLGAELERFDFADIAAGIDDKLRRRHPHVFGDAAALPLEQLNEAWEQQKARERAASGTLATLGDVPVGLPALTRAAKIGRRAGRVGFDWPDAASVREKVAEELAEADAAIALGDAAAVHEEVGDLLFSIVHWSRHLGVDPEAALRAATSKFERRFEHMERQAHATGQPLPTLDAAQWDRLWRAAKAPPVSG